MSIKLKSGNGPTLRAAQIDDLKGVLSSTWVTVQLSGGTATAKTEQDANFLHYSGATYYRDGSILVNGVGPFEIFNLTPTVGSVASDGTITRLASGILKLHVKTPLLTKAFELDLRDKNDEDDQPYQFVSTVANSLAEHLQLQVNNRLAGITGTPTIATNGLVYTTQDHTTPNYVRNPNLWCADVDLTCISPWNSNGGVRKAGTLITPRHLINAAHYEVNVGDTIRFVAADGTVHDRTVTGKKRHPNYDLLFPDITVYTLDSNLPASITPCELMPSNFRSYLVHNNYNHPPGFILDQEEKALIARYHLYGAFRKPTDATHLLLYEDKISGDSGNPAVLIVNGKLVLVSCLTSPHGGTAVADFIADINQMIIDADTQAGVSTGYTVTEADFSAFPSYA